MMNFSWCPELQKNWIQNGDKLKTIDVQLQHLASVLHTLKELFTQKIYIFIIFSHFLWSSKGIFLYSFFFLLFKESEG